MIAYKGFDKDLCARFGTGRKQYQVGEQICEDGSKTGRTGMHCAEYVLDCLSWYPLGSDNRYCQVEAAGSIDEDGSVQISCTQMTIVRELTLRQVAMAACAYMVQHPTRNWKKAGGLLEVKESTAVGQGTGSIAIARGKRPKVKGKAGSILGLVVEEEPGVFTAARVFAVEGEIRPNSWYTLTKKGELKEA